MTADQWAPLDYKLADPVGLTAYPGTYVPEDQQRRILAYEVLDALISNNAAANLNNEDANLREWGFAGLIVRRIVSGLLGGDVAPVVAGAAHSPPDAPPLPDKPRPPDSEPTPAEARAQAAALARYETAVDEALASWEQAIADYDAAIEVQRYIDQWCDAERYQLKLQELEGEHAVPLGDGVAVYGWSERFGRPTMRIYDPGAYFPVLGEDTHEYPTKVHLVWVSLPGLGETGNKLHRITYELGPIVGDTNEAGDTVARVWEENGERLEDVRSVDEDGNVTFTRTQTWGETTTECCYLTHHVWDEGDKLDWNALDEETKTVRVARTDIGINFIPIEHVPNTATTSRHFGTSAVIMFARLLEDFAAHCRDLTLAAALAAFPAYLARNIEVAADLNLDPGAVLNLGDGDGNLEKLDLAPSLAPLIDYADWLINLLSVVSEVGRPVLGITGGESNTSGAKVRLEQGPFEQMAYRMRAVRHEKYALGFKMVQRFAQYGGALPPGPTHPVAAVFGPPIAQERSSVVDEVTKLRGSKLISTATAVGMLAAAGFPIGDAESELDRIDAENFEAAVQIADATGDEKAAATFLGLDTQPTP